jgi:hypothetical protein
LSFLKFLGQTSNLRSRLSARSIQSRDIRFFEMKEDEIVDIDTLNSAIQETYQIWFEILEEREREARKSAETGTGGLFG